MLNKTQLLPDRPGIPPMAKMPEPETIDPAALAQAYAGPYGLWQNQVCRPAG